MSFNMSGLWKKWIHDCDGVDGNDFHEIQTSSVLPGYFQFFNLFCLVTVPDAWTVFQLGETVALYAGSFNC